MLLIALTPLVLNLAETIQQLVEGRRGVQRVHQRKDGRELGDGFEVFSEELSTQTLTEGINSLAHQLLAELELGNVGGCSRMF